MEEKSVDEYWALIGRRDYWAGEVSSLSVEAAILEERIAALQSAIGGMHTQEEILGSIASGVAQIPSACGLWQGARARENFMECTEGSLYGSCKGACDAAAATILELEAALRDSNTQFETVQASSREAESNFAFWEQKVVSYW